MKIFFSVGEPSGDLHGANLIRELKQQDPQVECVGYGGPRMLDAGLQLHADLTQFAVMWFLRVLLNLHCFWKLMWQADRYFREETPDAVVLIDYPGFNWWIARRAKANGVPVFYYGAPQMWAWAGWRIKKMRRLVDHVLCKLPFEAEWYQQRGCDAKFVGHPFFDETYQHRMDDDFIASLPSDGPIVTLLPGSRTQEVESNLEVFLDTAERIREQHSSTRFAIAAFNDKQARIAEERLATRDLDATVHVGRTPELIQAATVCLACSGSVSLQLMHYRKPTVIHYRISRFAYFVQRFFKTVRYITLVNLLAADDRFDVHTAMDPTWANVPYPEFLTCEDRSQEMSVILCDWLAAPSRRERITKQLDQLNKAYGQPGASGVAAQYLQHAIQQDAGESDGFTLAETPNNEAA